MYITSNRPFTLTWMINRALVATCFSLWILCWHWLYVHALACLHNKAAVEAKLPFKSMCLGVQKLNYEHNVIAGALVITHADYAINKYAIYLNDVINLWPVLQDYQYQFPSFSPLCKWFEDRL